MKFLLYDEGLNLHTLPFMSALYDELGDYFLCFVNWVDNAKESNKAVELDIKKIKWLHLVSDFPAAEIEKKIYEADVVMIAQTLDKKVQRRIKNNKLTFFFGERPFKSYMRKPYDPHIVFHMLRYQFQGKKKNVYMLCYGAYVPRDEAKYGLYQNKMIKWGYFPKLYKQDWKYLEQKKNANKNINILWAGRLSEETRWKKPEDAILAMEMLIRKGIDISLTIVGTGDREYALKKMVDEKCLQENIVFRGKISNTEMRDVMEQADIFLFTSNEDEGWGVVLNEAMNAGCCVVASYQAGATPYLVQDGINGRIYYDGNVLQMVSILEELISSKEKTLQMGRNAYTTIVNEWNECVAAKRIVHMCSNFLVTGTMKFEKSGPGSEAEIL